MGEQLRRHGHRGPGSAVIGFDHLRTLAPTHYHRTESHEAITIQSYVHLFSEHFNAASNAGLGMTEFLECVIDQKWLAGKPKWREYVNWPVSFALVWTK